MIGTETEEWVAWEAQDSVLELVDGRKVAVTHGDEVLIREANGGVAFIDHKARVLH